MNMVARNVDANGCQIAKPETDVDAWNASIAMQYESCNLGIMFCPQQLRIHHHHSGTRPALTHHELTSSREREVRWFTTLFKHPAPADTQPGLLVACSAASADMHTALQCIRAFLPQLHFLKRGNYCELIIAAAQPSSSTALLPTLPVDIHYMVDKNV